MGDMSLKIEYDKSGAKKTNPFLLALSPAPYVQEILLLEEDEFIVLACDGLFDVMSNQQVVDWVRANRDRSEDTKVLVHPDHADEMGQPKKGNKPMTLLKSQSNQIAMMTAEHRDGGAGRGSAVGGQIDPFGQIDDDDYKPNLAQELAHYAVKLGSMDNVSVVIVFLDAIPSQTQAKEKQKKAAEEEQRKMEKERKRQEKKKLEKEKKLRQGQQFEDEDEHDPQQHDQERHHPEFSNVATDQQ
jgi:serine/threonine protein phosphatase PrpC